MTVPPNRYADHWSRGDLVICHECSDRTLVFAIPRDEREEHDAWHVAADYDDRETARIMDGPR